MKKPRTPFLKFIPIVGVAVFLLGPSLKAQSIDLDFPLQTSEGRQTSLSEVMGEKDALLLDFWASRCGPCIRLMPALKAKHDKLPNQGIAVAAINTEGNPDIAETVRNALKIPSSDWLMEPPGDPFSGPLGIDSIPRMILIDRSGRVLFNGHPNEPALKEALRRINPSIS
jgi:thiol-disulfide isomerase/thioredoxin